MGWTGEGREATARRWSIGKNRANAKRRRDMPSRLASRLREAVRQVGLTCLGYEFEAGPADYPLWFDVWVRLPDGRVAGIDVTWDSGAPLHSRQRARQDRREAWMQVQGHPYLFIDRKLTVAEMVVALRNWLRKERDHVARVSE
jgi:hypothetical protein